MSQLLPDLWKRETVHVRAQNATLGRDNFILLNLHHHDCVTESYVTGN